MRGLGTATPSVIRAACRAEFYAQLATLRDIADDDENKPADRIKAIEALGRFGLGAADQASIHIHAEAGSMVGVIAMPPLGETEAMEPIQEAVEAPKELSAGAHNDAGKGPEEPPKVT